MRSPSFQAEAGRIEVEPVKVLVGHGLELADDAYRRAAQPGFILGQIPQHVAQLLHQSQAGAGVVEDHEIHFRRIEHVIAPVLLLPVCVLSARGAAS